MDIYTVADVARMLQVRKGYVYELIYKGELKAARLSSRRFRVTREALDEFLNAQMN